MSRMRQALLPAFGAGDRLPRLGRARPGRSRRRSRSLGLQTAFCRPHCAAMSRRAFMPSAEAQASAVSGQPFGPGGCQSGWPSALSALSDCAGLGRLAGGPHAGRGEVLGRAHLASAASSRPPAHRRAPRARPPRSPSVSRKTLASRVHERRRRVVGDEMARELAGDVPRRRRDGGRGRPAPPRPWLHARVRIDLCQHGCGRPARAARAEGEAGRHAARPRPARSTSSR